MQTTKQMKALGSTRSARGVAVAGPQRSRKMGRSTLAMSIRCEKASNLFR